MKVLIAPDKFKGSLTAIEAIDCITRGIQEAVRGIKVIGHPLADGGEGSLEIISQFIVTKKIKVTVHDPLMRKIRAYYLLDHCRAYIELSKASGLQLLLPTEYDCLGTTTLGTGELILDALRKGANEIFLFAGGSATSDMGMGIAYALGYKFLDIKGNLVSPTGSGLRKVNHILAPETDYQPIKFHLVCDVQNPLLGENGTAQQYAPQKGAFPREVNELEYGMTHFSNLIATQLGKGISQIPGSGVAGGVGGGMAAFFDALIIKGISFIMNLTHFKSKVKQADIVISGEGQIDGQTSQGKVIAGVAKMCREFDKPLYLICGRLVNEHSIKSIGARKILTLTDKQITNKLAMMNARSILKQKAFGLAKEILR